MFVLRKLIGDICVQEIHRNQSERENTNHKLQKFDYSYY